MSWVTESEATGRREAGKVSRQGSENAVLLLEDQNQNYCLGSKQDKQTNQSIVGRARGAKRANPKISLPAFPPSC
jgi:hypothetical protein